MKHLHLWTVENKALNSYETITFVRGGYIMDNKEFLSVLYERYGVLPPDQYDQDWEFTAGAAEHTED